ncbi:isoaspartyl peptidase/L-asparaginase family protein [Deinococcus humi]|uniref:Beta-aspartyl-peptidase (Threonine type) n=1 Tax=Deinococcus humi TaxID=662880 RepID=A0A7W8JTU4_9DEIO|nr:isoaspartyl peptidase/L-asparaginase family protein [Deinococcus humi]MBB5363110.1 beta-aspartyl-peptidase (threonine type) [Deinococcus humi]GGO24627.1 asparaginase [Deinococcus humi]
MTEVDHGARPEWTIIVHGGAHEVPSEKRSASRAGCLAALRAGREVLTGGGTAVEAVEAALRVLEDDPTFNAGYGSALNSDGAVEMDASLMDGATLDVGAVSGLKGVRHPISVARSLLREKETLLIADGARRFAVERRAELCDPQDLISPKQQEALAEHDTVGCVALDTAGHLAAGASTGGLSGQRAGRVGDTPQCGCGFYAEDGVGAVALTGEGESLARMMTAARIIHRLPGQTPDDVVQGVLEEMRRRVGGDAGGIAVTPEGKAGWWHNSPHMPVAYQHSGLNEPQVYLAKAEEERSVQT